MAGCLAASLEAEGALHELYRISDIDGKTLAENLTAAACERELNWRGLWGSNSITVTKTFKPSWGGYAVYGALPRRYMGPWPQKKTDELKFHYEAGKPWLWIENHFEASQASLQAHLKKIGVVQRKSSDHPMHREGGHGKFWLYQMDGLVKMFDAGLSLLLIARELNRTEKATWAKLTNTGLIKRKLNTHILGWYGGIGYVSPSGNADIATWQHAVHTVDNELSFQSREIAVIVDKLHPRVRAFVSFLVAGEDLHEAADSAGLTAADLDIVLPPLRNLLKPFLAREGWNN